MRSSWIEVDMDILRQNAEFVKSCMAPEAKMLVAIKADAYGHGAIPCARMYEDIGVDFFGVAIAEEGVELRKAGISLPILVLGATFPDSFDLLFDYNITPNIYSVEHAEALSRLAVERNETIRIHISLDTGLTRLGFDIDDDVVNSIKYISELPGIEIEGLFSMLATSETLPPDEYSDWQFDRFIKVHEDLKAAGVDIPIRHICEGGGTVATPQYHMEMVRPGTPLYGTSCGEDFVDIQKGRSHTAMTIKSTLAMVRKIRKGTYAGYQYIWQADKDMTIGIVPMGYVDGIFRSAAGKMNVLVNGVKCPVLKCLYMDQMTIDLTGVDDPKIGDEVVVLGCQGDNEITTMEIANAIGTIETEFICRIKRLPIYYKGEGCEKYLQ